MNSPVTLTRSGSIGIIEIDHPPVNASSQAVRSGLLQCVARATEDTSVQALILHCAGRTFMAGADIKEFDGDFIPAPDPNEVNEAIERFDRPVLAALHGTVLGGGLELALACHFRLALFTTKLGLPEVKLGLLPGAGGTQRLPRLVGIQRALDMMTSGASIGAQEALRLGMIDVVVQGNVLQQAHQMALRLTRGNASPRRLSAVPLDPNSVAADFFEAYSGRLPAIEKGGRAARAIVECVEAGTRDTFAECLRLERAAFYACKQSAESRALRYLFFAEREAARVPHLPVDIARRPVGSVGIIGAGTMGGGIAMNFASAGIPVVLVDVSAQVLERGLTSIQKNYEASAAKGRISADSVAKNMALISATLDDRDVRSCDLVIEAAFENFEVKKTICTRLGAICKPGAIIATNTSTLNVDVLAEATGRPADVLGMHFFSPANVMKLLEVVRGAKTDPQVLATVMALAKRIDKIPVVSGVCYGFIGNRMLEGYLRETERLLLEGAAPEQIDKAVEALGFAMGPCRMIDMAGVDVAAKVVLERQKDGHYTRDPSYRSVVRKLYELGRFGQKTGAGYYRYDGRKPRPDDAALQVFQALATEHGITRRDYISDEEIVERCLYPLINEGRRILDEGIAYRASDIDVVWVHGYGFPAYKGGPMYMATQLGDAHLRTRLYSYARQPGGDPHGYWRCAESLELAG